MQRCNGTSLCHKGDDVFNIPWPYRDAMARCCATRVLMCSTYIDHTQMQWYVVVSPEGADVFNIPWPYKNAMLRCRATRGLMCSTYLGHAKMQCYVVVPPGG